MNDQKPHPQAQTQSPERPMPDASFQNAGPGVDEEGVDKEGVDQEGAAGRDTGSDRDTATQPPAPQEIEHPSFEAILYPRRSLSPRGFTILLVATGIIGFAWGSAFLILGAWPIFGFCGTEWLLMIYLFRKHLKGDRRCERLRLYGDRLMVEQISPKGQVRRYRFQPYWLQVVLDRPDEPDCSLYLRSHGKQLEIGAFLSPQERRDIAGELRQVLNRWRTA